MREGQHFHKQINSQKNILEQNNQSYIYNSTNIYI